MRSCHRLFPVGIALLALVCGPTHAQVHVCGPNEYPVSVENDATIYCVASRPCSGDFDRLGHGSIVGSCPMHAGCALLPQTPNVMGCMKANLPDVAYVGADGSLTRNGIKVPGVPTSNTNTNANANNAAQATKPDAADGNTNANANANTDSNAKANGNANANANPANANGNAAAANAGASANATSPVPTTTPTPSETATSEPPMSSDGSTSSSVSKTSIATNQQSLDNINNDPMSKAKTGPTTTSGLGSTVAIGIGCLAVVAIVAGVFVLRKNKQEAGEEEDGGEMITPMEAGVNANGYGGMTPKDQVQLL